MAVDLQTQLQEAEQAYHNLMVGQSVAEFRDQNGELVRYTPANATRLLAYITSLKMQLGGCPVGPARVWF
ncbi:gpW family protein [Pseudomonas stutzeri]|uniref:gpW family protein n=1 Tax=Stutzerimonas stutzeri TaxID=316 RepID=UPI00210C307C|nr:gpW family protein [Stutzerimonas stutzeri]MCQ4311702.1 gpW family protein [Stutzerimonas stutzeri]